MSGDLAGEFAGGGEMDWERSKSFSLAAARHLARTALEEEKPVVVFRDGFLSLEYCFGVDWQQNRQIEQMSHCNRNRDLFIARTCGFGEEEEVGVGYDDVCVYSKEQREQHRMRPQEQQQSQTGVFAEGEGG